MQAKKSIIFSAVILGILIGLMSMIWINHRPAPEQGEKEIVVEVIHKDGRTTEFAYQTDQEYLSEVLLEEGLIAGAVSEYGLYVETVDGETAEYAVDQGWWQLSCNGERAQVGADQQVIRDGDRYTWTYTIG